MEFPIICGCEQLGIATACREGMTLRIQCACEKPKAGEYDAVLYHSGGEVYLCRSVHKISFIKRISIKGIDTASISIQIKERKRSYSISENTPFCHIHMLQFARYDAKSKEIRMDA